MHNVLRRMKQTLVHIAPLRMKQVSMVLTWNFSTDYTVYSFKEWPPSINEFNSSLFGSLEMRHREQSKPNWKGVCLHSYATLFRRPKTNRKSIEPNLNRGEQVPPLIAFPVTVSPFVHSIRRKNAATTQHKAVAPSCNSGEISGEICAARGTETTKRGHNSQARSFRRTAQNAIEPL